MRNIRRTIWRYPTKMPEKFSAGNIAEIPEEHPVKTFALLSVTQKELLEKSQKEFMEIFFIQKKTLNSFRCNIIMNIHEL